MWGLLTMLTSEMLSMLSTCTSMPTGMAAPETMTETSQNHECISNRHQCACQPLQPRDSVWSVSSDNVICLHRYLAAAINNCPPHTYRLISGFSLFKANQENMSFELHTLKNTRIAPGCSQAGFYYFRPFF